MRVTIEHRDKTSGVLQNHKEYYIDCQVEFSEEERSIIRERDLYKSGFTIGTSTPPPSSASVLGTIALRVLSPLLVIGGIIASLSGSGLSGPLIIGGSALFISGWIRGRKEDKRWANDEQMITVKRLLHNPRFTVNAWSPIRAQALDEELREHLADLKAVIVGSAQLQEKQTFDL